MLLGYNDCSLLLFMAGGCHGNSVAQKLETVRSESAVCDDLCVRFTEEKGRYMEVVCVYVCVCMCVCACVRACVCVCVCVCVFNVMEVHF